MEPLPQRKPLRLPGYDYSQNGAYFVTLCTEGRQCLFDMCPPPSTVAADSRAVPIVGADSISARVPSSTGSAATQMVQAVWRETVASYEGVSCPKYVLMPNHFHALLVFDGGRTGHITRRADMESAPTGIFLLSRRADMEPAPTGISPLSRRADMESAPTGIFLLSRRADMESAPTGISLLSRRADMESAPTGISLLSQLMQSFKRHTTIRYTALVRGGQTLPFQKRVWQRSFYDHVIRSQADYERIWQYIDENPAKWAEDTYYKETTP